MGLMNMALDPPARWLRTNRWVARWWRRLPPARQDRLATVGPLISVLLFLAAIASAFWFLRNEEIEREAAAVLRDVEITQQQIALRLIDNQEQLLQMARELASGEVSAAEFEPLARSLIESRPEIQRIEWLDARQALRGRATNRMTESELAAVESAEEPDSAPEATRGTAVGQAAGTATSTSSAAAAKTPVHRTPEPARGAFQTAREERRPAYSAPFEDESGNPVFQVLVPLIDRGRFSGALATQYSLEGLLWRQVPQDVSARHRITAVRDDGTALASTTTAMPGQAQERGAIVHEAPMTPAMNGILLRGEGWRTSIGLIGNTLFWMVMALSVLTLWMLIGTWRHVHRRAQIQAALVKETQFRRAMENSMLTGMRALDMDGRITYVNAAFCQMIGFSESELLGCQPPYPYWPPDRIEENRRLLLQEMQGRNPAGGIEVRLVRKDGRPFDARMYVSPLIGPKGNQTGWMTSMTNITEAKRIRDQLAASHERFTTVLEGLDASVSVLSVRQGELLFANRSYRLWFGADARGHALLSGSPQDLRRVEPPDDGVDDLSGLPTQELTDAVGELREVYAPTLDKWFEVRSRYLQWTDASLAQMLIATDITARRRAEEQAALQAEKAAVTSRLMTMGEMASTVAHELNQPLTAITNYCNGMLSRMQAGAISEQDLVTALQKTARQAERAGQIIHRIRAFVKKSEPQRQLSDVRGVVEEAVELAGIELRRRNVAIRTYLAQRLPPLLIDPILIGQVVLNLLKNAAEAIDTAQLPAARRHVELRVVPRQSAEEGEVIEFSVTDAGPGLREDVVGRLYEAFFSTKPEGLGIGLNLCRSIVESHRGRMRAQNLYNGSNVVGCLFSFTLPVDAGAVETAAAEASLPEATSSPPPTVTLS